MDEVTGGTSTAALVEADIHVIQRILPHRYPFLLVDRVRNIQGTTRAQGVKNVTMNEPYFQGHFPAEPVMPGVLIIEAMAQTSGVMIGAGLGLLDMGALIYFMGIDNCKFRRKVVPGDQLLMDVETLRGRPGGRVWKLRGVASVDGEVAAEADFTAMIVLKGD